MLQGGPVLRYKKVLPIRYKKGSSVRYNHRFFAKLFTKGSPIRYNVYAMFEEFNTNKDQT